MQARRGVVGASDGHGSPHLPAAVCAVTVSDYAVLARRTVASVADFQRQFIFLFFSLRHDALRFAILKTATAAGHIRGSFQSGCRFVILNHGLSLPNYRQFVKYYFRVFSGCFSFRFLFAVEDFALRGRPLGLPVERWRRHQAAWREMPSRSASSDTLPFGLPPSSPKRL